MFNLNGAGVTTLDSLAIIDATSRIITDNRFAVINGMLVDINDIETATGIHSVVSIYDANEVYNPSNSDDLLLSYTPKRFIVAFEFSDHSGENALEAECESKGQALFMHLIEHALRDSNQTKMRLNQIALGSTEFIAPGTPIKVEHDYFLAEGGHSVIVTCPTGEVVQVWAQGQESPHRPVVYAFNDKAGHESGDPAQQIDL